jgi:hypothetical protein
MKTHLIVLYDSIFNSVFQGQVLAPLIKQLNESSRTSASIISFEHSKITAQQIASLVSDPRINIIVRKKIPFMGASTLWLTAWQLKTILKKLNPTTITARGPLAGWIVAHASPSKIPVIVQARGLATQEYLYAHEPAFWWHRLRARQYESIEQYVYGIYAAHSQVTVQTVSKALKNYVIQTWQTPENKIMIATHDIPQPFPVALVHTWRKSMRKKIGIPKEVYVYVYNGSAHPWQCPEQTVQFFVKKYHENTNSFLLILTQSIEQFHDLLHKTAIPAHAYHVTRVAHTDIYHYLAAADVGLLFREQHCINWVSRPTKALEYQAVGLKIMHNNTIEMLTGQSDC